MTGGGNIQINLMNYRLEPEIQRRNELVKIWLFVAVLVMLIGLMAGLYQAKHNQLAELQKANQNLKAELARQEAVHDEFVSSAKLQTEMGRWRQATGLVNGNKLSYSKLFDDFDQMNVPGIFISNIEVKPDMLNVRGYTSNQASIADVVAWMTKTKRFGEITSLDTKMNKENGEFEFNISVPWKEARP